MAKKGVKAHRTMGKSYREVSIGGKKYTLRPLTVGTIYGEMEAYVLSLRSDPLEAAAKACSHAPESMHQKIWAAAIEQECDARIVTASELNDFENSVRGIAWKLWQSLKQDHRELDSVDKVIALLESVTKEELAMIQASMHIASGEADAKN